MPPKTAANPWTRYRPIRTGESGGYTETLADPIVIYMLERIHQDQLTLEVDIDEDVLVGDILTADEVIGSF